LLFFLVSHILANLPEKVTWVNQLIPSWKRRSKGVGLKICSTWGNNLSHSCTTKETDFAVRQVYVSGLYNMYTSMQSWSALPDNQADEHVVLNAEFFLSSDQASVQRVSTNAFFSVRHEQTNSQIRSRFTRQQKMADWADQYRHQFRIIYFGEGFSNIRWNSIQFQNIRRLNSEIKIYWFQSKSFEALKNKLTNNEILESSV
jgi:hypothetical protein